MSTPHRDCQAVDTVLALWNLFEARDWPGARALLADDVVVEWPATGERFTSADAFVAVNATYPEGWTIQVQRVVCGGASTALSGGADLVISEVQVPQEGVGVRRCSVRLGARRPDRGRPRVLGDLRRRTAAVLASPARRAL
jgi:hypothetical protein